jgi:hypothetical protein
MSNDNFTKVINTIVETTSIFNSVTNAINTFPQPGWNNTNDPSFVTIIQDNEAKVFPAGSPSPYIATSELTTGSVWELYTAGVIEPDNSSNGSLEIGISLSNLIDSIDEQIGVVKYDNSLNSKAQFEYHGTFRVINNPNLDKFLKVTHIGKLVSIRNNDQVVRIALRTFEDSITFPADHGYIGIYFCAAAIGATFKVTRNISYLRRIIM